MLHPGALGDIILSLPALGILRRHYPGARITLAANLDFSCAVATGYADTLLSFSTLPLHHLFVSGSLPENDRQFWSAFDRILSWTGCNEPQFVRNLNSLHPSALVVPWRPRTDDTRHVSRIFVQSLHPWVGDQPEIPLPRVSICPADRVEAEQWLGNAGWNPDRPMVGVHAGAGSMAKRWPLENFRELAGRSIKAGLQVLIIEGPAERGLSARLTEGMRDHSILAARFLPLQTLAAVLSFCAAFVGNDSGIAHLSAALDIPGVVMFGPTHAGQWAPAGPRIRPLQAENGCLALLPVDSVWDALTAMTRPT